MLRYNNINVLFILIVLILVLLIYTSGFPWWSLIVVFVVYSALLVIGSVNIQLNFYIKSLTKLEDKKSILLTFDDGPDEVNTPKMLDLLDQYKAKAAFFMIGDRIVQHPNLVKEIHQRGHIVGNHSYSHSNRFLFFCQQNVRRIRGDQ